jgi:hypothetical protein
MSIESLGLHRERKVPAKEVAESASQNGVGHLIQTSRADQAELLDPTTPKRIDFQAASQAEIDRAIQTCVESAYHDVLSKYPVPQPVVAPFLGHVTVRVMKAAGLTPKYADIVRPLIAERIAQHGYSILRVGGTQKITKTGKPSTAASPQGDLSTLDAFLDSVIEPESEEEIFSDESFDDIDPLIPTAAKPGSDAKVRMLAARFAARIPLFHEEDCDSHAAPSGAEWSNVKKAADDEDDY